MDIKVPKPTNMKYSELINDIKRGEIRIPQFQRKFVWDKKGVAKLLDSIIKGYPIGTFIFWRTIERFRDVEISGSKCNQPKEDVPINYVLDGQQRITSIFIGLTSAKIDKVDYSDIYLNLLADGDQDIVTTDVNDLHDREYIKLSDFLNMDILDLTEKYNRDLLKKISYYRRQMDNYDFSVIEVKDIPIEIATEIFTRINVGGKSLSVFEIMCAKTYDISKGFDLHEKIEGIYDKLETISYETISETIFLQVSSMIIQNNLTKKHILSLRKEEFIKKWDTVVDAVYRAIDYLKRIHCVKVSRLLPYNALLVPFSYYFYKINKPLPIENHEKYLTEFFFRVSLTERYNTATESRMKEDIEKVIIPILNNKIPKYDSEFIVNEKFIRDNGYFQVNKGFIKAMLCLLARKNPKSFNNDALVTISNDYLKVSHSKNYHHFFPKKYLENQNVDYFLVNHIANITIVDGYLNKGKIKAKPPCEYLREFKKNNTKFESTMKSHYINNVEEYGIWDNDYNKFFKHRIKKFVEEINALLNNNL